VSAWTDNQKGPGRVVFSTAMKVKKVCNLLSHGRLVMMLLSCLEEDLMSRKREKKDGKY
jgi:hypothetical protein